SGWQKRTVVPSWPQVSRCPCWILKCKSEHRHPRQSKPSPSNRCYLQKNIVVCHLLPVGNDKRNAFYRNVWPGRLPGPCLAPCPVRDQCGRERDGQAYHTAPRQ